MPEYAGQNAKCDKQQCQHHRHPARDAPPQDQERIDADLTNWLEYFVGGFAFEMQEVKEIIIPLSLDNKMLKKLGGQVYLDKKQIKIVDFMMTMGKITSNDVVDILNDRPT